MPPPKNFQDDLAEGRSLATSKDTASGSKFRIPKGVKRIKKNTCSNIDKERGAHRQQAKYFICTC